LDWVSLGQSEEFAKLDQTAHLILQRLRDDSQNVEDKLDEAVQSNEKIYNAISQSNHTNTSEHTNTKSAISKQIEIQNATNAIRHDSVVGRIDDVHNGILKALISAAAGNRIEHEITRAEIQRTADLKIEQIRKEVCRSRFDHGESSRTSVTRIGNISPVELQKLQEWSTAKLGVWFAKDVVLTCLQVSQLAWKKPDLKSILIATAGLHPNFFHGPN
jgi:hypothetical protein